MSLLSVSHLRKSFGGAVALRDASLELRAGETLALMGENGAGKSTLIKILAGAVAPDGGSIRLDGEPATLRDPGEAHRRGLRFIHQELNVVPSLSVAENIFLGRSYPRRLGLVDWRALNARARSALKALDVEHIGARTIMARLSVGDRMLVKIAAAFLEDAAAPARIFVMDEPTAALTGEESERLFRIIDSLRRRGCGIIYVSHRLDEVLAIADRISVLRDGETQVDACSERGDQDEAHRVDDGKLGRGDRRPHRGLQIGAGCALRSTLRRRPAGRLIRIAQGRNSWVRRPGRRRHGTPDGRDYLERANWTDHA